MLSTVPSPPLVMAPAENAFYRQLGRRIAERRKALGITQVQLAETLGIAQQTMAHYEGGRVRFAAGLLPLLAETLNTSIEALIGETSGPKPGKRGPAPKIQRQLERVSALPKPDQRAVMRVLDSMLAHAGR